MSGKFVDKDEDAIVMLRKEKVIGLARKDYCKRKLLMRIARAYDSTLGQGNVNTTHLGVEFIVSNNIEHPAGYINDGWRVRRVHYDSSSDRHFAEEIPENERVAKRGHKYTLERLHLFAEKISLRHCPKGKGFI